MGCRMAVMKLAGLAVVAGVLGIAATADASAQMVGDFSYGELQAGTLGAAGCGSNSGNSAFGPSIRVSRAGNVFLGSSVIIDPSGTVDNGALWRGLGAVGGASADACGLQYLGGPTEAGDDVEADLAVASAPNATGDYQLYVAGVADGSPVAVASSADNGAQFTSTVVPDATTVQNTENGKFPQPRMATFGATTSLLSYGVDVWRSTNGGSSYSQSGQTIPSSNYQSSYNEMGNLAIDHDNLPDQTGDFYAYHAFVAPTTPPSANSYTYYPYDEAFLAVSSNGGATWNDEPIACSEKPLDDLGTPSVSVAPNGDIWAAWDDAGSIYTAESTDHGQTWTCSPAITISNTSGYATSITATSGGVDLAFDGTYYPGNGFGDTSVYFAQDTSSTSTGWSTPEQLMDVSGGLTTCAPPLGLALDTDNSGWAHIAYGQQTCSAGSTGYAAQTTGTPVGSPNN